MKRRSEGGEVVVGKSPTKNAAFGFGFFSHERDESCEIEARER